MNVEISETIKDKNWVLRFRFRSLISELDSVALYERKFVTRVCHAHSNAHKST